MPISDEMFSDNSLSEEEITADANWYIYCFFFLIFLISFHSINNNSKFKIRKYLKF